MIIRNTIATSTALRLALQGQQDSFSLAISGGALFGLFGGAAFTSALCAIGWLIGIPTLVGGLLGWPLLQVLPFWYSAKLNDIETSSCR